MRLFECRACAHPLSFDEMSCEGCQRPLGFIASESQLRSLDPAGTGQYGEDLFTVYGGDGTTWRACANRSHGVCNWLLEMDNPEQLCLCCRTNMVIPDLSSQVYSQRWRDIEVAKHRLFYSLLRLGLAVPNKADDPVAGLSFSFLADENDIRVLTGHDEGLITLNIVEADAVEREKMRTDMHEPYRTLLGHFRHEIGHYYWDRLVRDAGRLEESRAVFGDESIDYNEALQAYYGGTPPADWQERYVSQYATAHAWEDFAETFAHYMHMLDTLETAYAFGLRIRPKARADGMIDANIDFDPYRNAAFSDIVDAWGPLTLAMNSINRSMGQPDLYPFKLGPGVIDKLAFIDQLLRPRDVVRQAA
jgi:hypothetical protein